MVKGKIPLLLLLLAGGCSVPMASGRKAEPASLGKNTAISKGQSMPGAGNQVASGASPEGAASQPWWAERTAPAFASALWGNERDMWQYPYASVAASDLLGPLDIPRAFVWDELWEKNPEDRTLDWFSLRDPFILVRTDKFRSTDTYLWFVLGRSGKCKENTVLVARWIKLGRTSRDEDTEYREALEEVLRSSQVTELKCKTGNLPLLNALASDLGELSISSKIICDLYLNPSGEDLPGFSFRYFGFGDRSMTLFASAGCGTGLDSGNLLSWYARAVRLLEELRRQVKKGTVPWPWCTLVTEDGLTFLEKRPPHPPLGHLEPTFEAVEVPEGVEPPPLP